MVFSSEDDESDDVVSVLLTQTSFEDLDLDCDCATEDEDVDSGCATEDEDVIVGVKVGSLIEMLVLEREENFWSALANESDCLLASLSL